MGIALRGTLSRCVRSVDAGRDLGRELAEVSPSAVLVFASVEHDQAALLGGLREVLGPTTRLLGCSAQGVMGRGATLEGGYFAAALGFGGDFTSAIAHVEEAQTASRANGEALGRALRAQLPQAKLAFLFFDPLCGVNVTELLAGFDHTMGCLTVGGGASQPWGPMVKTHQFVGEKVISHGVVALALDGPFVVEIAASHGTEPVGLEHLITRAVGNQIVEFDGRPAAEVWKAAFNTERTSVSQMATLAIGLPNDATSAPELGAYRVLSPTIVDAEGGTISVLATVPEGARAVLHYRSAATVLEGTRAMTGRLLERIAGRRVLGVVGFECGARTEPFLGREATLAENLELQQRLAPDGQWVGLMAWGEVLPLKTGSTVVNYTYPLICFLAA